MLGETLAVELKPFSIRVLIVEPGGFRTLNKSFTNPAATPVEIPAYDSMRQEAQKNAEKRNRELPGDPKKAMSLLVDVIRGEGPAKDLLDRYGWPLYLPIGKEAEDDMRDKCGKMTGVLDIWGKLIRDTDLDEDLPVGSRL